MAGEPTKGRSPFYPGQPVPAELFVGRKPQLERILQRGVGQVSAGKPVSVFVQGEYGIGKSSIAGFVQYVAEKNHGLHGIYAPLGGAGTLEDMATIVLEATVRSGALHPTREEAVRNWLAKYIGKQEFFGIALNADAMKQDAPGLSSVFSMLGFLSEVMQRLDHTGVKGVMLILDEINGIASNPKFALFVKGLVDTNAMSSKPLPLLLVLCGVEERRREMIQQHQPVDRLFDVIEIEAMSREEMEEFFRRAFAEVGVEVEPEAMDMLTYWSAGFPKIMHVVGDAAYWIDQDNRIDKNDASRAVVVAADEVGKKYVDQQVFKALGSKDYKSILSKIAKMDLPRMSFTRAEVASGLTASEKKKLDNFLRRMKGLKVIRAGDSKGEYVFNVRMVRLYIWLAGVPEEKRVTRAS
jgi:hypothetical protein